jgi:hypothetical protein
MKMTTKKITVCDVCKKEVENTKDYGEPGGTWTHASIYNGYYGPNPVIGMPCLSNHDSSDRTGDFCSAKCLTEWLKAQIEHIAKVGIAHEEENMRLATVREENRKREEQEDEQRFRERDQQIEDAETG